jgi:hypothetical protein
LFEWNLQTARALITSQETELLSVEDQLTAASKHKEECERIGVRLELAQQDLLETARNHSMEKGEWSQEVDTAVHN